MMPFSSPVTDIHREVLSPRFVEGRPNNDTRMKVERLHHAIEFQQVLLMSLGGPFGIFWVDVEASPRRVLSAADLILPDHHAKLIAMEIISPWLNLDVLADHVEACRLQELNVRKHRLIRWRRQ